MPTFLFCFTYYIFIIDSFLSFPIKPYIFLLLDHLSVLVFALEDIPSGESSIFFIECVLLLVRPVHSGNGEASLSCEFSLPLPCFLDLVTLFLIGKPLILFSWLSEKIGGKNLYHILTFSRMWSYVMFHLSKIIYFLRLFLSASWVVFVLSKLNVFICFALFHVRGHSKMCGDSKQSFYHI